MDKAELQPSHNFGRSGSSRPYHRKKESRHSCAPSSIPFTLDGCTVIHAPIFVTRHKRHAIWTGATAKVSISASSNPLAFRFLAPSLLFLRNETRSAFLNSSCPLSALTRCPVMTQDAVQYLGDVSVGSGRARPAYFIGRWMTCRPGIISCMSWKSASMKDSRRDF